MNDAFWKERLRDAGRGGPSKPDEGEPCCICGDWIDEGLFRRTPDGRMMCLSCASGDPMPEPAGAPEKDD